MSDLIAELQAFPLGAHDDLIDSLASQLPLWGKVLTIDEEKVIRHSNDPFAFENIVKELRKDANENLFDRLLQTC
jgi:hypothetical protein